MSQVSYPRLAAMAAVSLVAAMLLSLAPLASANMTEAHAKAMSVEQQTIVNIVVPASDLKVEVSVDRSNGVYAAGERARVFLKANQTARVELVDVSSTGVKTVLFPNGCQPNNIIQAGQTVEVGVGSHGTNVCSGITVSAPYGLSVLKAVATTDQGVRLEGSRSSAVTGSPFARYEAPASSYARAMSVVVNQAPSAKWATANLFYSVTPPGVVAPSPVQAPTQVTVITDGGVQVVVPPVSPVQPPEAPVTPPAAPVVAAPVPGLAELESDFGINLVLGKPAYRIGEKLSFSVTAERRCDLRVVNVDHKGGVSVLYPNTLQQSMLLESGQTAFFPQAGGDLDLTLSGEPGTQTLVALCAENKSLWDMLSGRTALPTAKPTMTLEQITSDRGDGKVARKAVTYALLP